LGSLLDIPAQLAMLLSLAASNAAPDGMHMDPRALSEPPLVVAAEPLEGPMRFGERAWLRALQENPAQSGGYGSRVFVTSSGRYYVPTTEDRRSILEARNDGPLAAGVARAAADRNAARLQMALGRAPCAADLYVAHVIGSASAIAFLRAVDKTPDLPLREAFPGLQASLRDVSADGAAQVTVHEFYRRLREVLREHPRLVAIGLKPMLDEALPAGAWQAKVDVAEALRAPRAPQAPQ
jgi:hypothetical protein